MGFATFVPHLDLDVVHRLITAAWESSSRAGERKGLLVAAMFDGCLRASEALGLRPVCLARTGNGGWVARVVDWTWATSTPHTFTLRPELASSTV